MYAYCCLAPGEAVRPLLQHLTYTYLPAPLLLPPIQAHNFCSRPPSLSAGEWAARREYHCFHATGAPLALTPPVWAFPQAYAAALQPPFPAPVYRGPSLQEPAAAGTAAAESGAQWPEGDSLQAELRWGRVERALGPRLRLPDFVCRELRRVYGTYPRTDVRVTYRGGEFLLQGAPRVCAPEDRVRRRALSPRTSSRSPDSSPAGEAAERGRRKERKGLG
ncbi:uncharacterized protein C10orf95 homolog [Hippopotamus amphibius kiboko]|uniref:uncharacterized protein C10orf95 homolog n=1 Tax=Hippopotamus amphibius kiboko TaxID=575201 RepID=UPI0025953C32|nr:uncharacterized protein C10orf95 homolog [Hippopotamus amphibius kiboko]XP_057591746.1 uncharacterized protein C10orf95 homolog [Hippopotamus amphibius kiboko]